MKTTEENNIISQAELKQMNIYRRCKRESMGRMSPSSASSCMAGIHDHDDVLGDKMVVRRGVRWLPQSLVMAPPAKWPKSTIFKQWMNQWFLHLPDSHDICTIPVLQEGTRAIRGMNGGMIWMVRLAIISHSGIVRKSIELKTIYFAR
jgi:hypothetical protein